MIGSIYKKFRAALDQHELLRLRGYGPPTTSMTVALSQLFASGPFFRTNLWSHSPILLPGHESSSSCEYYEEFFSDHTRSHEWHIGNDIHYLVALNHLGYAKDQYSEVRP